MVSTLECAIFAYCHVVYGCCTFVGVVTFLCSTKPEVPSKNLLLQGQQKRESNGVLLVTTGNLFFKG